MSMYPDSALRRAMKIQEIILRAMSGEITWIKAAWIIGVSDRSMRRWKVRYEKYGYDGLFDRRRQRPSPKRAPFKEVKRILRLYRETYMGFNVRHFHQIVQREHRVKLSYTFVKKALQESGLVARRKSRGRHRKRRERRACFGELVHIDGSEHVWLLLVPDQKQSLIALQDDATGKILYAQLWEEETSYAIMSGLWHITSKYGICMSLYSDRASWAFYTPKAGGKVDRQNLTQVGVALDKLGIEHIASYSPQGRGRGERLNRTLQDRLVNELRVAGVTDINAANEYLNQVFIPQFNKDFGRCPRDPESVFVSFAGTDLKQIFCFEAKRVVNKDNTVRYDNKILQTQPQPLRRTCSGLHVLVRHHLDGSYSVWKGPHLLGRFDSSGNTMELLRKKAA